MLYLCVFFLFSSFLKSVVNVNLNFKWKFSKLHPKILIICILLIAKICSVVDFPGIKTYWYRPIRDE